MIVQVTMAAGWEPFLRVLLASRRAGLELHACQYEETGGQRRAHVRLELLGPPDRLDLLTRHIRHVIGVLDVCSTTGPPGSGPVR